MVRVFLLGSVLLLASCATSPTRNAEIESAVRWGVDACERHLLDGVALEEALAQSAEGRTFELDTRDVEHWHREEDPFRLDGLSVYVAANATEEEDRDCHLIAVGAGTPAWRDALINARVTGADRTWIDATRNVRGLHAACTLDRVPDGRSVLLTARVGTWAQFDTASIPDDPVFQAGLELQDSCERDPDFWM